MQHHFLVLSFLQKRRLHINVDLFRYSYLLSYFLGQFIFDFLGGLRNLFGPTVFQLSAGNLEFDLHFSQILNHSILVLQKSLDNDFDLAADFRLFSQFFEDILVFLLKLQTHQLLLFYAFFPLDKMEIFFVYSFENVVLESYLFVLFVKLVKIVHIQLILN